MNVGFVRMNLEIKSWYLVLSYFTVVKKLGYSEFIKQQPELAVKNILNRVTHSAVKQRILITHPIRKKELKRNYGSFRGELAKNARDIAF